MASGETFSAASIRSPSFSRSSSSTMTIIRPTRISSRVVGTSVKTGEVISVILAILVQLLSIQHHLKLGFNNRPLGIEDAEINRVALAPVLREHMFPQGAFFFGSKPQDGTPRALIQRVGLELHAKALPDFKGMAQHQIFRFGVDYGA